MRRVEKMVVSVLCVLMALASSYGGDLVVDGALTVNGATKVNSLVITNSNGADLSVDTLRSVDAILFEPMYSSGSWYSGGSWITNRLSVVNVHAANSCIAGTRGSNLQSLQFDGQLVATTPLDDPYFMYLDTIVGMGAEIGSADCFSEYYDFDDEGWPIPGIQGGYLKLKTLQYGFFEKNSATLQMSGDIPNEIDVSGHFDMQGNQVRNGVFVGDGSHLTGVKAEQWRGGAFDVDVDMGSNELENVSALKFKPEYLRTGSSTYTYVTNGLSIRNVNRLYFNDEQVAMVDDRFNRLHIDGYVEIGGQYRPGTSGTCDGYLTLKSSNGGTAYDSATLRLSADVEGEIDVYGSLDMQGSTISDGVFAGDGSLLTGVKAEEWQGGTVDNDIDLSGNILENMSVIKFAPVMKRIGSSEFTYITNCLSITGSESLCFNESRVAMYSDDFNKYHIDGYAEIGGTHQSASSGKYDGYLTLKSGYAASPSYSATLKISSDVEGEIDVYGSLDMQGSPIKNGVFVGNGAGLTDIPSSAITETDPVWQAEKGDYAKVENNISACGGRIGAGEYHASYSVIWDGSATGVIVTQKVTWGGMTLNGELIVTEDDLTDYVTDADLADYVTDADLVDYVTDADLVDYVTDADLVDYVTDADLTGYVTDADLTGYVQAVDNIGRLGGTIDSAGPGASRSIAWNAGSDTVVQQVVNGTMVLDGKQVVTMENDTIEDVTYSGSVGDLYVPPQGDLGMGTFTAGAH